MNEHDPTKNINIFSFLQNQSNHQARSDLKSSKFDREKSKISRPNPRLLGKRSPSACQPVRRRERAQKPPRQEAWGAETGRGSPGPAAAAAAAAPYTLLAGINNPAFTLDISIMQLPPGARGYREYRISSQDNTQAK